MLQRLLSMLQKKEEGFTLVELLIVVAIIAILAAIAIPQFSAYRKRGYAATINSDAKNIYTATQAVLAEYPDVTINCVSDATTLTNAGYKKSAGVACSGSMDASSGTFSVYDSAGTWKVTTATIDYVGTLTKSMAN